MGRGCWRLLVRFWTRGGKGDEEGRRIFECERFLTLYGYTQMGNVLMVWVGERGVVGFGLDIYLLTNSRNTLHHENVIPYNLN